MLSNRARIKAPELPSVTNQHDLVYKTRTLDHLLDRLWRNVFGSPEVLNNSFLRSVMRRKSILIERAISRS